MISDFMSEDYEQTLKIASKKHDITGIRVIYVKKRCLILVWFRCLMLKRVKRS
jgi:hypothetical protein